MDKNDARKLMEIFSNVGALLNSADPIIRKIQDEDEKQRFLNGLGGIMADLWLNLEHQIVKKYPDLDPDKE